MKSRNHERIEFVSLRSIEFIFSYSAIVKNAIEILLRNAVKKKETVC